MLVAVTFFFNAANADTLLDLELSLRRELQSEPEPSDGGPSQPPSPPAPPQLPPLPPPSPMLPPRPPLFPGLISAEGCTTALGPNPEVQEVAAPIGSFETPRALAFNPASPGELWVADSGRDALTVLDLASAASNDSAVLSARILKDRAQYHYMDHVSALSFAPSGHFATCQESLNTYEGKMMPNFFMGPTLYDSKISLVSSKQETCLPGETVRTAEAHAALGGEPHAQPPLANASPRRWLTWPVLPRPSGLFPLCRLHLVASSSPPPPPHSSPPA